MNLKERINKVVKEKMGKNLEDIKNPIIRNALDARVRDFMFSFLFEPSGGKWEKRKRHKDTRRYDQLYTESVHTETRKRKKYSEHADKASYSAHCDTINPPSYSEYADTGDAYF